MTETTAAREALASALHDFGDCPECQAACENQWPCGEAEGYYERADALLPYLAEREAAVRAEAEIAGQMKHISAEVARGDVPLSDTEEFIADLRARLSHVEAERDDARAKLAAARGEARAEVVARMEAVGAKMTERARDCRMDQRQAEEPAEVEYFAGAADYLYESERDLRAALTDPEADR